MKINLKFISRFVGIIIIIESILMIVPTIIAHVYNEPNVFYSFYFSIILTFIVGILLYSLGEKGIYTQSNIGKREGYISVTISWLLICFFGMFPYYFSGYIPSLTDSFFESMSGFTTTGSSILDYIEYLPMSILFWRSFTHWIGGIGIIVFIITILPLFGGSALSIFKAEVSGLSSNQIKPRVAQVAKRLSLTYLALSLLGFFLLWLGPMNAFDAATHIFSAISTGGFSTKQASIAHFSSAYVEYVFIFFMFIGGTNFTLLYLSLKKRKFSFLSGDQEFKWYSVMIIIIAVIIAVSLFFQGIYTDLEISFRNSLFSVVSIVTTTGFVVVDYTNWGSVYIIMFLFMMIFCASSGSTSGGIKIYRLIILFKSLGLEFKRQIHPNAVLTVFYNKHAIPQNKVNSIMSFVFIYFIIFTIGCMLISISGIPLSEAIGASLASISNIGPGIGNSGPVGSFSHFNDFAKIIMSLQMLVGRLEVFTILSIFIPSFWK